MKQRKPYLVAGVFALVAGLAACAPPSGPTTINVGTQTQTVTINPGLPGANPSPTPGPGGPVSLVKVTFFGQDCPAPLVAPTLGSKQIRVGCTAHITASAFDSAGKDLCLAEGSCAATEVDWTVSASADKVISVSTPSNNPGFNRDVLGVGVGKAQFRVKFRGVEGVLDVDVVA